MASPRSRRFAIFRAALDRHLSEACVLGFGLGGIITIMVNRDYGLIMIGALWGLSIALLRRPPVALAGFGGTGGILGRVGYLVE